MRKLIYPLLAISLLTCACEKETTVKPDEQEQKETTSETEKEQAEAEDVDHLELLQEGIAKYGSDNWKESLDYFADDAVFAPIGSATPPSEGKEAIAKTFETFKTAFPDSRIGVTRAFVAADDVVVVEVVETGTHEGPLAMGPEKTIEPTNKKYGVHAMHVAWFDDDHKIKRYEAYSNEWTLMAQLGTVELKEGQEAPPVAKMPTGEPEVVEGEKNEAILEKHQAMTDAWLEMKDWDKYYATDVVVVDYGMGEKIDGREAYANTVEQMLKPFSQPGWKTSERWSVGNWVIVLGKWNAKHTGEGLMGMKPTNKEISGHNAELFKFKDGKLVWSAIYSNPMEMMMQLQPPKQEGAEDEG